MQLKTWKNWLTLVLAIFVGSIPMHAQHRYQELQYEAHIESLQKVMLGMQNELIAFEDNCFTELK